MLRKGYKVFEGSQPYDLNIVGIRSSRTLCNTFDDLLTVFYKNTEGQQIFQVFPATTDPGLYWLEHPMHVEGTAIILPGQYQGAYQLGLHRSYRALKQVGQMDYVRDANRDNRLDIAGLKRHRGVIGANIHRASPTGTSSRVDKWSAGCQVFADYADFEHFLLICEKAARYWGNRFSYTLLNETDLAHA